MKTSTIIDSFLLDKRVYCSSKTILNYTEHLNRFMKYIPKNIEDLTSDDIRKYIIHLKDIEADSLVYFKIVEYKENSKLENLLNNIKYEVKR